MKNLTRIGAALLGTWSAEVTLSDRGRDRLTAYLVVHFMADARRGHGCAKEDCVELENRVCVMEPYDGGEHSQESCKDMGTEKDVSWSDVNAFFYFGVHVDSKSKPKAKFELSTGDWIGPFSVVMAQEDVPVDVNATNATNTTLVDRYVARYVQSQSIMPSFLQNRPPLEGTLYNKRDDYVAFLGTPALKFMTQTQTNFSISNDTATNNDPYGINLLNCDHGDLRPILPLFQLDFFNHTNRTELQAAFKMQYKLMAVPTPEEQAYHVLPLLQSKFQGQGQFNILAGPYCYGDDPNRGYSFDLQLDSSRRNASGVSFVRGCLAGGNYPCVPPAALGGASQESCNHDDDDQVQPNKNLGVSNIVLLFLSYGLAVALLVSLTVHWQIMGEQRKKKKKQSTWSLLSLQRHPEEDQEEVRHLLDNENPTFFDLSDSANQREDVNPFGDLDPVDESKVDPLKEPLVAAT